MSTVAAVITTFNNAETLVPCLKSLQWVDQILILDSFSTDSTVAIGRQFTQDIHFRPFENFSDQKNFAIRLPSTEWVLVVDADEEVPDALAKEIQTIVSRNDNRFDGYLVPRKNLISHQVLRHGGFFPDYILRLSRVGTGTYSDHPVHSGLKLLPRRVGRLEHSLIHHWSDSLEAWERKWDLYASLEAEWLKKQGHPPIRTDWVLALRVWFKRAEIYWYKRACLDGPTGRKIAQVLADKMEQRHLKLRQLWSEDHVS